MACLKQGPEEGDQSDVHHQFVKHSLDEQTAYELLQQEEEEMGRKFLQFGNPFGVLF